MLKAYKSVVLASAFFAAACAQNENGRAVPVADMAAPSSVAIDLAGVTPDMIVQPLPGETMIKGQCKLFVWSLQDNRPLIAIQDIGAAEVRMNIAGTRTALERSAASRPIFSGAYAKQTFAHAGAGLNVEFDLVPASGGNLQEGIKIPRGTVVLSGLNIGDIILSVTGLVACQL